MIKLIKSQTILLCCLLWLGIIFPTQAKAEGNFEANLKSTYTINELGNAQVVHDITLINNTPTLYVTQYALKVNSGAISHVEVFYNNKPLNSNIATSNNETSIGITFTDKVVGKGQQRQIQVKYQTPDLVEMTPSTLGVTIPKLTNPSDYAHYQATIKTPKKYGLPSRTTPAVSNQEEDDFYIISQFNNLNGWGITAQFGQSQTFSLDLSYHLVNSGQNAAVAQVALPPDTSWQQMFYEEIKPIPQNITLDDDGNWIASFLIQAEKDLNVRAKAKVKLSLEPIPNIPVIQPLPAHLKAINFWEADNEKIKDISSKHQQPTEIYNYVIETLDYGYPTDSVAPQRKGAVNALAAPDQAVCQEFTDLFVTLSRANNIPARRITGYAYTKNNKLKPSSLVDNVLHAWPEYFDTSAGNWKQIDPTWEETTGGVDYFHQFDLNHITFAINGISSSQPQAVGLNAGEEKEISVTFTTEPSPVTTQDQLIVTLNPKTVSGLPIPGLLELSIHNQSGQALYQLEPSLKNSEYWLKTTQPLILLPFQSAKLNIYIKPSCWFACGNNDLQLQINDQTYQLKNIPTSKTWIIPGILGLAFIGILLTLLTGSVLVFKRKR